MAGFMWEVAWYIYRIDRVCTIQEIALEYYLHILQIKSVKL